MGNGIRMDFKIQDPRAERFVLEIFGPMSQSMQDRETLNRRLQATAGISLDGPSADDPGAQLRPSLGAGGSLAVLLANMVNVAASFNVEHKKYCRISRTAFALGAPIYHGDDIQNERKRDKMHEALQKRGTRGLGDLSWVERHYRNLIDCGPYFIEDSGRKWWEYGLIVIPQSRPAAMGSSATIATDVLLRVRTDVAGNELYLELTRTDDHRSRGVFSGVFGRASLSPPLVNPNDVKTIEQWQ